MLLTSGGRQCKDYRPDVVGERQTRDTHVEPMAIRKPFDGAEFQVALDRTISCLTLARQHATLRRHLATEQ